MQRMIPLLLLLALIAVARPASADNAAEARALFDSAKADAKAGDCRTAAPKFARAYQLDPKPGTLRNLAYCQEQLGLLASAWRHFREVIEKFPASDHVEYAKERAAALEPRVPRLTIRLAEGAPDGTKVLLDGSEVGVGAPLPVNPGEHRIVVRAHGRADRQIEIPMREGEQRELAVDVGDRENPATSQVPKSHAADVGSAPRIAAGGDRQRTVGFIVGGVGVVGLGAGLLFLERRGSKLDDRELVCPARTNCTNADEDRNKELTEEADSAGKLAAASFVLGGAAVVGGIVLVLTARSRDGEAARLRLATKVSSSGARAEIGGVW